MSGRQITEADVDISYDVLALLRVSIHTADALQEDMSSANIAESAGALHSTLRIVQEKCGKLHDAMEFALVREGAS